MVRVCSWGIMVLAIVMTVVTLLQVFFRYVVYAPFPASEEIARFSMIWMAMLGCAVALRWGRHLGVRALVDRLPAGLYDRYMAPCIHIVMMLFFAVVTLEGWNLADRNVMQQSPALEISMFYPYLAVPVGGALMFWVVLADFLQDRFPTHAGSTASIASAVLEDLPTPAIPRNDVNPFITDDEEAKLGSSDENLKEPRS